jgi:DNA invertase Pin-like site-specific DNA recombinase
MSGASTDGRDGLARMIADARRNWFDIILAEDFDRISRNLGDLERFREDIEHIGIEIRTVADGAVTQYRDRRPLGSTDGR